MRLKWLHVLRFMDINIVDVVKQFLFWELEGALTGLLSVPRPISGIVIHYPLYNTERCSVAWKKRYEDLTRKPSSRPQTLRQIVEAIYYGLMSLKHSNIINNSIAVISQNPPF